MSANIYYIDIHDIGLSIHDNARKTISEKWGIAEFEYFLTPKKAVENYNTIYTILGGEILLGRGNDICKLEDRQFYIGISRHIFCINRPINFIESMSTIDKIKLLIDLKYSINVTTIKRRLALMEYIGDTYGKKMD